MMYIEDLVDRIRTYANAFLAIEWAADMGEQVSQRKWEFLLEREADAAVALTLEQRVLTVRSMKKRMPWLMTYYSCANAAWAGGCIACGYRESCPRGALTLTN